MEYKYRNAEYAYECSYSQQDLIAGNESLQLNMMIAQFPSCDYWHVLRPVGQIPVAHGVSLTRLRLLGGLTPCRSRSVDLVLLMSRKALASVVFIVVSVIKPGLAPNG